MVYDGDGNAANDEESDDDELHMTAMAMPMKQQ